MSNLATQCILSPHQHRFRQNHSCQTQLIGLIKDIQLGMDNHQYGDVNQSYQMSPSTQLGRVIDQLMFLIYINDITTNT